MRMRNLIIGFYDDNGGFLEHLIESDTLMAVYILLTEHPDVQLPQDVDGLNTDILKFDQKHGNQYLTLLLHTSDTFQKSGPLTFSSI